MQYRIRDIAITLLLMLLLVGCAGAAGGGISSILAAVMTAMLVFACANPSAPGTSDSGQTTAVAECDGEWESCCSDGVIEQCCCPEGMACNYGMFQTCADGSCAYDACPEIKGDTETPDVIEPIDDTEKSDVTEKDVVEPTDVQDCEGQWENCCTDGKVGKCCCPEGVACNYGMYETCDDGSCVGPVDVCSGDKKDVVEPVDATQKDVAEPIDVTEKDAGDCEGQWESCCMDGKVGQCCCPDGVECNYGDYKDCGDGLCAPPPNFECPPEK